TIQSMEAASPVKWNLAHTSWFFETFVLAPHLPAYEPFHPQFGFLFNSYYQQVGAMHARAARGVLSRPSVEEVGAYRAHVDAAMDALFDRWEELAPSARALVPLGLAHEEQHQELLLTDVKHALSLNPLEPAIYDAPAASAPASFPAPAFEWIDFDGGVVDFGVDVEDAAFAFDNEGPRHQAFLRPFRLAARPTTNGEFQDFIEDGGYQRSELWLSDAWALVEAEGWRAPLYWRRGESGGGEWFEYTLFGRRAVDPEAPLAHISYYEAAAFAEWRGARLPTEYEWERAAAGRSLAGQFLTEAGPQAPAFDAAQPGGISSLFGAVWEWTASPYAAYPGFHAAAGAIGEYNGKFMCNQMVLRGGSCATPAGHIRATYRNFFPPDARWQFAGLRLASDR
ncbi:MAG: ergothioneine biosynthesis protein EgtB, partial [Pseudomonadota bacterium]